MAKKTLLIDQQDFIDWYFDHDICKDFFYRHSILDSLTEKGVFKITLKHILNSVGYLPERVVAKGQTPILDDYGDIILTEYDVIKFKK